MCRPKLLAAWGLLPEYCPCMMAAVCGIVWCKSFVDAFAGQWTAKPTVRLPCQPLSSPIIHGAPRSHGSTSVLWLHPLARKSGRGAWYYSTIGNILLMPLSITRVIYEDFDLLFPLSPKLFIVWSSSWALQLRSDLSDLYIRYSATHFFGHHSLFCSSTF